MIRGNFRSKLTYKLTLRAECEVDHFLNIIEFDQ